MNEKTLKKRNKEVYFRKLHQKFFKIFSLISLRVETKYLEDQWIFLQDSSRHPIKIILKLIGYCFLLKYKTKL